MIQGWRLCPTFVRPIATANRCHISDQSFFPPPKPPFYTRSQNTLLFSLPMEPLRAKTTVPKGHPLYKTELCIHYPRGSCRLGKDCSFAHGRAELRAMPKRGGKLPCKWGDKCRNKDSGCTFGHGTDDEGDSDYEIKRPIRVYSTNISTTPANPQRPTPAAQTAWSAFPPISPTTATNLADMTDLMFKTLSEMGFPEPQAAHAAFKVASEKRRLGSRTEVSEHEVIEVLFAEQAGKEAKAKADREISENASGIRECTICCDRDRDAVFLPCGHASFCKVCGDDLKRRGKGCPVCRKPILEVKKVYY